MYLGIAAVLVVLWVWGYIVTPIGGSLIHLLLVIAVVAAVWHFVKGRNAPRV
jgi:Family of unknown function (DUF5670)